MIDEVVWPIGKGFVALDYAFMALTWAACFFNVYIDRRGYDRRRRSILWRRTYIVGFGWYAATLTYRMWELGDIPISVSAIGAMSLLCLGSIGHGWETIKRVRREDINRA